MRMVGRAHGRADVHGAELARGAKRRAVAGRWVRDVVVHGSPVFGVSGLARVCPAI